jgi:hypothetical protein
VEAVQGLIDKIGAFAKSITTKELTFTRATGDDLTLNHELCIKKSDGTPVCLTGDQLEAVLAASGQSTTSAANNASSGGNNTSLATDTPPVISINGDNPAVIHVGDSYIDLGAAITGPQADLNLGIKTHLNGTLVPSATIDTSAVATDTIDYIVIDQNGLTSTTTR